MTTVISAELLFFGYFLSNLFLLFFFFNLLFVMFKFAKADVNSARFVLKECKTPLFTALLGIFISAGLNFVIRVSSEHLGFYSEEGFGLLEAERMNIIMSIFIGFSIWGFLTIHKVIQTILVKIENNRKYEQIALKEDEDTNETRDDIERILYIIKERY